MKKFLRSAFLIIMTAIMCLAAASCSGGYVEPEGNAYYDYKASATRYGTDIRINYVMEEIDSKKVSDFVPSDQASDYVLIKIKEYGDIVVLLRYDVAPVSVKNFKKLVSDKYYDGTVFHRVVEDFMIQGGGYTVTVDDKGNTKLNEKEQVPAIIGEFTENGFENRLAHVRGVISMARTGEPNSATSQFFIVHENSPHLNDNYASFGYVLAGMDVVDAIAACEVIGESDSPIPVEDVVIESVTFVERK